jgi:2-polyprenyl-3-methyl-5-hydroxy-6-metoxy-1,4-benzoquinol methylase
MSDERRNNIMKNQICRLCETKLHHVIYDGPIRSGGVGSGFVDGYKICQCQDCGLVSLTPLPDNLAEFYESEQYRQQFFEEIDAASMQRRYDIEQNERVSRIGIQTMRGKVVADFGAGPGLFLDAIQGVAKKTIAVEPSRLYQEYFQSRGHLFYSYAHELLAAGEKPDVAVSFDTIEHVLDLKDFVRQIYVSLKDDGIFYLSMPNYDDIVRLLYPQSFEPFFFQVSHLNYFTGKSASLLLEKAGFGNVSTDYLHKYNINNLLQWVRNGKPGAFDTGLTFDEHFQNVYVEEIKRLGIASHIIITARK